MVTSAGWLLLVSLCAAPPEIWPGFLGAGCGADDATTLPLTWSESHNIAWTATVPQRGLSSPAIWKDRLFVTSIAVEGGESRGIVTAFRLTDGAVLWRRDIPTSRQLEIGVDYSNAAPSPAVDSRAVYALFESGDLLVLTHAGEELWRRSLVREIDEIALESGLASSLAQDEASVFCLVDHERQSYLTAFDKRTGERRWLVHRDQSSSWSSPICVSLAGVPQVIVSSSGSVDGYAAHDGSQLWTLGGFKGNNAPTPCFCAPDRLLIGATLERGAQPVADVWHSNVALRIVRGPTAWKTETLWQAGGAIASYASPTANRSHAYWLDRRGRLTCFFLSDGRECYSERVCESAWATPLAVGNRVYIVDKLGVTTVVESGNKFVVLARNELDLDGVNRRTRPADDGARDASQSRSNRPRIESAPPAPAQQARSTDASREPTNVYALCAVNGSLIMRTNRGLVCLRDSDVAKRVDVSGR